MSLIHDPALRRHLLEAFGCGNYTMREDDRSIRGLHGEFKGTLDDYTRTGMVKSNMAGGIGASSSAPEIKF